MTRYSAGMDSGNHGTTRTESKTLYVEGLPLNCTKRGCTYSSPLSGFFEVRLVNKESRYAGSSCCSGDCNGKGIALRSYVHLRALARSAATAVRGASLASAPVTEAARSLATKQAPPHLTEAAHAFPIPPSPEP
uniref:Uncharacterized protein n=2 Tax=Oryza punctata TaxID=4537 RepID=A0A0E0M3N4_ORYPU